MQSSQVASHWTPDRHSERFFPQGAPAGIELYARAWVPGTHVEAYFGPISAELFIDDRDAPDRASAWLEAQIEVLEVLRERARLKHANAVIGLEMVIDPFARCPRSGASGLYLCVVGTAAKLKPL